MWKLFGLVLLGSCVCIWCQSAGADQLTISPPVEVLYMVTYPDHVYDMSPIEYAGWVVKYNTKEQHRWARQMQVLTPRSYYVPWFTTTLTPTVDGGLQIVDRSYLQRYGNHGGNRPAPLTILNPFVQPSR